MMKSLSELSVIDWVTLAIRLVFVLVMSLWLTFAAGINWLRFGMIVMASFFYLIATIWVLFGADTILFRIFGIIADMLLAYLCYAIALSFGSYQLGWFSLLPLITASLYFQWMGTLVISLLNIFLLGGMLIWFIDPEDVLTFIGLYAPLSLVVSLPIAYYSYYWEKKNRALLEQELTIKAEEPTVEDRRGRAIIDLISTLSSSLSYQRVLENSLDLSVSTLMELEAPADKLISAVLLFLESGEVEGPELAIASSRRFPAPDLRITLPAKRGMLGKTIDTAEIQVTKEVKKDVELTKFLAVQSCQSGYAYPLRSGLDVYGILFFAHPDPDFFTLERQEILEIVGNQSVIAMQNARLYQDLENEKERIMEIQEDLRKKMARDLHDGPTQTVSAIAMRVNFARRLLERDVKAAGEELYKIEDLARRTTKEIRHMLFILRPLVLESQGLIAALESIAEKMRETYGQNVIIQADPRVLDEMEKGKQSVVFYIAEEAINNARKHAQADHIWTRLRLIRKDIWLLEVEDDGVGFDKSAVSQDYESRSSLGMVNMRERADLINGVLRIDSTIGQGTRIQVIIPLTEEAADRIRQAI